MGHSLTQPDCPTRDQLFTEFIGALVYSESELRDRQLLNLRRLMLMRQPDACRFDPTHLPLLYLIDEDKDGLFSLHDLMNLGYYRGVVEELTGCRSSESVSAIEAFATGLLAAQSTVDAFAEWFVQLLEHVDGTHMVGAARCVPSTTIYVLHTVLKIGAVMQESFEQFLEMFHRAGLQLGLLSLEQERMSTTSIPVVLLKVFATTLYQSFSTTFRSLRLNLDTIPEYVRPFTYSTFPLLRADFQERLEVAVKGLSELSVSDTTDLSEG
ncbi:hypothetical protein GMRT_11953 [Giardia muris]|uniref:Uncharacterized protein n=1 Tax=Giardia muris TaxID=5742 RepID=A0A4Z1SU00_GIAMU|nr:hypothetical protein GMRT_11953 [Giardia muris]|eukprot:TNJ29210.1 hypothetical protein GMRT_11953 [Giardia muris]